MSDHKASTASRTAHSHNNTRQGRLGDLHIAGRSPAGTNTMDESSTTGQKPTTTLGSSGWIWGGSGISGAIGSGFNKSGGESTSHLHPTSNSFDPKQGSSSLLSGEFDSWVPSKPALSWTGESTSPGRSSVPLTDGLSRSPVRIRNSQHDASQTTSEIPRSTSPYTNFLSRPNPVGQAPVAQPPTNKSYLDAAGAFNGGLDFQSQGFGGAVAQSRFVPDDGSGRGRVVSNSRGHLVGAGPAELLVNNAAPRSESLPPQRANSTPPTYGPDNLYPQYQSGPTSHLTGAPMQPNFTPTYHNTRRGYEDLSQNTRDAEVLAAQLRQMAVGSDNNEQQNANANARRTQYPVYAPTQMTTLPTSSFQPQFGDFNHYQQRQIPAINPQPNPWAGGHEETQYPRSEPYSTDTYGGTVPPLENGDYRRSINNQYIGNGNTPPPGMELRTSSRSGASVETPPFSGYPAPFPKTMLRSRALQPHQQGPFPQQQIQLPRDQVYRSAPFGMPYDFQAYNGMRVPMPPQYNTPNISSVMPNNLPNARRQEEFTHNLRSVLLEEFRSNSKSNRRYELKDLFGHIVEFSGDQHGSRFIQQKLETANSDDKDIVFKEIRQNTLQLMTDVFGNYVIQKFFEHGSQVQKNQLAEQMKGHVLTLSLQMYGCRVVQKALEFLLVEQQAALMKELDGHVLKCVKDQNGNHVVQKAIERCQPEHVAFIIQAFAGQVHSLATHPYGCRVIQRMLEYCNEQSKSVILQELHICTYALVQDQYGNYVTQHIIKWGNEDDRNKVIQLVTTQLLHFSKHKFASNVVEHSIEFGTDEQRREIVKLITTPRQDGTSPLQILMRDQYGNYVIQRLLAKLCEPDKESFIEQIKPQIQALKKFTYPKQITAIEKLIYSPSQSTRATPPLSGSARTSNASTPSRRHNHHHENSNNKSGNAAKDQSGNRSS